MVAPCVIFHLLNLSQLNLPISLKAEGFTNPLLGQGISDLF